MSSSTPSPVPAVAGRRFASRLLPRSWRGRLLALFSVVLAVMMVLWVLSRAAPPWYQPLDATDQGVIDLSERGQALLLDLRNAVQRVPNGTQTWTISQDELNSYIAIQFARVIDTDTSGRPPLVSAPMVGFTPGKVTVSARTSRLPSPNKAGGVGSLVFDVKIVPGADGKPMGFVQLSSVWAGCLPLPKSAVESRLQSLVPAITAGIQQALQAQFNVRESAQWSGIAEDVVRKASAGQPFGLEYRVDRRQLVIKELRVEDERLTVVIAPPGK